MSELSLEDLPPPPEGKSGWPWTEGSEPCPIANPPAITILIPSFNQGPYLEQSIRSVLLQRVPGMTVHLRDGGSTDASLPIITRYAGFFDTWVSEPDGGQCAVINEVLKAAPPGLAGYMNADDFYQPNGIHELLTLHAAEPENVLWAGRTEEIDTADQQVKFFPARMGTVEQLAHWYIEYGFHQPSCLFRAEVFQEVGGMDENLVTALDVDLWLRMRGKGGFASTEALVSTVRNNPEAKTFKNARLQIVELLAVMHRSGLNEAALWRLNEFVKEVERDTLNALHTREDRSSVLGQYTWKELMAELGRRLRGH